MKMFKLAPIKTPDGETLGGEEEILMKKEIINTLLYGRDMSAQDAVTAVNDVVPKFSKAEKYGEVQLENAEFEMLRRAMNGIKFVNIVRAAIENQFRLAEKTEKEKP